MIHSHVEALVESDALAFFGWISSPEASAKVRRMAMHLGTSAARRKNSVESSTKPENTCSSSTPFVWNYSS